MAPLLTVLAHIGPHTDVNGLTSGFTHPWGGLDHLLAMLAVGLLATRAQDRRALGLLPAGFIGAMLLGGAAATLGIPFPGVEAMIAASVIVLGLAVALWRRVSPGLAIGFVAIAGGFHGYAHLAEVQGHPLAYGLGMTLATAALHALGLVLGLALLHTRSAAPVRLAGAAIALGFAIQLLPI